MNTKTTPIAKDGIPRLIFASVVSFETFVEAYVYGGFTRRQVMPMTDGA